MMSRMSIRKIFLLLTFFGALITLVYMYFNYQKVQELTKKNLYQESLTRSLIVSKKMSQLNDEISVEFAKYEKDIRQALQIAKKYFSLHGKDAPLEPLFERLNNQKNNLKFNIYLINRDFVIDSTTFKPDIGLDFHIIPDSLSVLQEVFKDEGYIDLSAPMYERITSEYTRYIVQKAEGGEYLIQIGLVINYTKTIREFAKKLHKEIPTLIKNQIVFIYPKDESAYVMDLAKYQNSTIDMTKKKSFEDSNIYEVLSPLFSLNSNMPKEKFDRVLEDFIHQKKLIDFYYEKDGKYIHRIVMPFYSYLNSYEKSVFALAMEFDESNIPLLLKKEAYFSIMMYLFMAFLALLSFILINRRIIEPLTILQSHMKAKKKLDVKHLIGKKDEIISISFVYNQLLKDIRREVISNEELLGEFKTFTANSIHQVRTPVSVIKIALEMVETQSEEAMNQIKSSLVSIEHLYDTLSYTLSQDELLFETRKLDISQVLKERIKLFEVVALASDKEMVSDISPDIFVNMNRVELEFLIDNNLSNALKYSFVNTRIRVILRIDLEEISLVFESEGKLIEDRKIIFERYVRRDKSRKGNGIGLHMVDTICKKNSVFIHVDSYDSINRFSYFFERM